MILTFKGPYGSIVDLCPDGEIQGYEFVEPPIEYRFLRAGSRFRTGLHQCLVLSAFCGR